MRARHTSGNTETVCVLHATCAVAVVAGRACRPTPVKADPAPASSVTVMRNGDEAKPAAIDDGDDAAAADEDDGDEAAVCVAVAADDDDDKGDDAAAPAPYSSSSND